jgi:NAD(P)-dependent dehydrogenase (short-subunit alcohol dehydrogenase family)
MIKVFDDGVSKTLVIFLCCIVIGKAGALRNCQLSRIGPLFLRLFSYRTVEVLILLLISTLGDVYGIILKDELFTAMAVARAIQPRDSGAIVQTGWLWAQQAIRTTLSADYLVVNAGVHVQPRNQALELASPSISINSVAPAIVESLV